MSSTASQDELEQGAFSLAALKEALPDQDGRENEDEVGFFAEEEDDDEGATEPDEDNKDFDDDDDDDEDSNLTDSDIDHRRLNRGNRQSDAIPKRRARRDADERENEDAGDRNDVEDDDDDDRESDVGDDMLDENDDDGLRGLAKKALEILTEKEGKSSPMEWGKRTAFKGIDVSDEGAELSPWVKDFLKTLPALPPKPSGSIPLKLKTLYDLLQSFYITAPDASLDVEAHCTASRSFASSLSSIIPVDIDNRMRPFVAGVISFVCAALLEAHKDVSGTDANLFGSLTYLELWFRNIERRNHLTEIFPALGKRMNRLQRAITDMKRERTKAQQDASADRKRAGAIVSEEILADLDGGVEQLLCSLQPLPEDIARRDQVIAAMERTLSPEALQKALKDLLGAEIPDDVLVHTADQSPSVEVKIFGSAASGLNFRASADIDFSLVGAADCLAQYAGRTRGVDTVQERSHSRAIALAAYVLSASPEFAIKDIILTSRVPIVKCVHVETGLACDVASGNSIALKNTQLLRTYSLIDPRVRPLMYAVKYWAKKRGICDASLGTLSSYAWTLLVIFFLQQTRQHPFIIFARKKSKKRNKDHRDDHDDDDDLMDGKDEVTLLKTYSRPLFPVLPCLQAEAVRMKLRKEMTVMNGVEYDTTYASEMPKGFSPGANTQGVGELLLHFFIFYAYVFDIERTVVSIRLGKPELRKNLENYSQANWRLAIEDPFELQHDLGSKIAGKDSMECIRNELRRAAKLLAMRPQRAHMSLCDAAVMQIPGQIPAFPRRCFNCGSGQHRSAKCPLGAIRMRGSKVCHMCGESGHLIRNCPLSRKNRERRGTQGGDAFSRGDGGRSSGRGNGRGGDANRHSGDNHGNGNWRNGSVHRGDVMSSPKDSRRKQHGQRGSGRDEGNQHHEHDRGHGPKSHGRGKGGSRRNEDDGDLESRGKSTPKDTGRSAKKEGGKSPREEKSRTSSASKKQQHSKNDPPINESPRGSNLKEASSLKGSEASKVSKKKATTSNDRNNNNKSDDGNKKKSGKSARGKPAPEKTSRESDVKLTVEVSELPEKGSSRPRNPKPSKARTGANSTTNESKPSDDNHSVETNEDGSKNAKGPKQKSQRVCRDWIAGSCRFGDRCKFQHVEKDNHPPGF